MRKLLLLSLAACAPPVFATDLLVDSTGEAVVRCVAYPEAVSYIVREGWTVFTLPGRGWPCETSVASASTVATVRLFEPRVVSR